MVEKKYSEQLRIHPRLDELTFKEHVAGVTAEFDQALLQEHLPVTSGVQHGDKTLSETLGVVIPEATRHALKETDFIGVYGRVVRSKKIPHLICLQYLYVWDYQAVPAHEGDYEPIFVYLDKKKHYAVYDLVHYCARKLDFQIPLKGTLGLRMIPGWHSFLPAYISDSSRDRDLQVKPLSDQHLRAWWSIPEKESRLKIVNHLKDPFQLEAPGHFMDEPDENSMTMCCTFLEIEKAYAEFDDPKVAIIEGIKRAFAKCVGLLALYRLNAFIQLLGEMNDIGMVNAPISTTGVNFTNISNLLRDGLVSITKVGKAFFDGLYTGSANKNED
ncbi:hypothetical protein EU527_05550 [Candidatus Thorarchaeota archaeon]|nr:MAG: hypothetical protein EU527_05550 [Candidatus Thorarchaeota archaeon]